MDEDQSFVFKAGIDRKPLPQSLPENVRIPLPPTSLPSVPMPSTLPPSPPPSSLKPLLPTTANTESKNFKPRQSKKKKKKKKPLKFCMEVPFLFRTFMNPNHSNTYQSSYIAAPEDDDGSEFDSSWVDEDYGEDPTLNLYRNPNRGLGNSTHGAFFLPPQ